MGMTNTQQQSYEWHTATATDGKSTYYFASLDGESWVPVAALPDEPEREHVDQLRAIIDGTDTFKPMLLARRGISFYTDLNAGGRVEFFEVVRL